MEPATISPLRFGAFGFFATGLPFQQHALSDITAGPNATLFFAIYLPRIRAEFARRMLEQIPLLARIPGCSVTLLQCYIPLTFAAH
jgi:hypothetical protein